jgi:hypothetical protein
MVPYYQPSLSKVSEEQRQIILQLADGICQGRIPFLSYDTQLLGTSPPWSRDFVSGKEWPMEPSCSLAAVHFDGSDVKVAWEFSRLQFMPLLGKAYCLTHKTIYRKAAMDFVDDWISRNPVGQGVNWMVAMEVALRALSVAFLLNLIWPLADEEKQWADKVTQSLWQHLLYIEDNLEFSHIVRGNHYLSNLVGLYGLAVFLEGPGMTRRRSRYRLSLEREILHHVYTDGGSYEASTGYHVLVTQIFLTAYNLMRADGVIPAPSFMERLRKMFDWMETLADCKGRLPHIGDCDDGRVEFLFDDLQQMAKLPLAQRDSLRVGSLLDMGAALFGPTSTRDTADSLWYGMSSLNEPKHSKDIPVHSETPQVILPQSGIAVARRGMDDLLFLNLPNGIRGKGTHTHNDKLSLILRLDGEEVLCDPGTGCYTRDGEMRNRFRSTKAHNTVTVDGDEQNRIPSARLGFFSLGNEARVSDIRCEANAAGCRLSASHFGYAGKEIVHTRIVEWMSPGHIKIEDRFSGFGHHILEASFHAGPGWKFAAEAARSGFSGTIYNGLRRVKLDVRAPSAVTASPENAAVSWLYGTTIPSVTVRISVSANLPASFITNLSWSK